ncbi:protein kinase domain-containing protein [Streptomyces sp. NPDC001606]
MATTGDAAGRIIARRYRLLSNLGAGGMGRVWLAHDQELDCEVALKELAVPPDLSEHELNARIARARSEARHAARLRGNPHVITVYDCVVNEDLPWIVMEYVPGARDLEAVVRDDGPVSRAVTARIGLALLDALTTGHQLHILHRDVKPSNVLVTSLDPHELSNAGNGRTLLTDYGISLREDAGEPRLTTVSGIIGTPDYLAPERARGGDPTPASDIFSLGATLYFAVEGRGPFDRGTPVGTLTALLTEDPTPPRRAGNLAPILLELLAKDPAQRLSPEAATHLLTQLTTEGPRTLQATVTQTSHPAAKRSNSKHHPVNPHMPTSAEDRPGQAKKRISRRAIILTAATLAVGLVSWLTVTLSSTTQPPNSRPPLSPSATGPVEPYGDAVGLPAELRPGDCVTAHWRSGKFTELPQLTLVDCTNDIPDGQVLASDVATSVSDAQANGYIRCMSDVKDTVNAMADAQPYSLPPTEQGWRNGVHKTACIVFDKTVPVTGDVGKFRKLGEQIYLQNSQIGDCYVDQTDKSGNITASYLAKCSSPHDEQTVGFVKVPATTPYKTAEDSSTALCQRRYRTYRTGNHDLLAGINDQSDWNSGFRYIQCDVYRTDNQKLTSSLISAAP